MPRAANPDLPRRILDEGEAIIEREGHSAINMRSLAKKVGVTATSIYHYFESKEGLMLQLKLRAAERLNSYIQPYEDEPDQDKILKVIGIGYIRFAQEHPMLYRFLFETSQGEIPIEEKDVPVLYHTYQVAKRAHVIKAERGEFTGRPDNAAMIGWTMLHGFCSLMLSGLLQSAEGLDAEQLKEMFLQFYTGGDKKGCDE